jgi:hypothetical protein
MVSRQSGNLITGNVLELTVFFNLLSIYVYQAAAYYPLKNHHPVKMPMPYLL